MPTGGHEPCFTRGELIEFSTRFVARRHTHRPCDRPTAADTTKIEAQHPVKSSPLDARRLQKVADDIIAALEEAWAGVVSKRQGGEALPRLCRCRVARRSSRAKRLPDWEVLMNAVAASHAGVTGSHAAQRKSQSKRSHLSYLRRTD